jgi:hypothetical protein
MRIFFWVFHGIKWMIHNVLSIVVILQIVEPCQQARWSKEDLQCFVSAYQETPKQMDLMKYVLDMCND